GYRYVGARHESERPYAPEVDTANVQQAITELQRAGGVAGGTRPESIYSRKAVSDRSRRDVNAHPCELAAHNLLQMQRRAGDPEGHQGHQQQHVGRAQSSHLLLLAAPSARPTRREAEPATDESLAGATKTDEAERGERWSSSFQIDQR